ncbi:MAG: cyclodeaminase/cyclohydrolase family protein [Planctomycetes bacterium]|nr:cyclodeaminase/cyclohydrolase family protein [Planctomycetota bacterium]
MIQQPFTKLIESLAARTPTPGGGAAGALAAAMGTALLVMVVRFSRGKKSNAAREADLAGAETFLQEHLQRILPMAQRDCDAFDRVSAAYALPKATPEALALRERAVDEGMAGALAVPSELMALIRDVLLRATGISDCVSKNIVSDMGSGAELLCAAGEAAFLNVRINAAFLKDRERAGEALRRDQVVMEEIQRHHASLRKVVDAAIG